MLKKLLRMKVTGLLWSSLYQSSRKLKDRSSAPLERALVRRTADQGRPLHGFAAVNIQILVK